MRINYQNNWNTFAVIFHELIKTKLGSEEIEQGNREARKEKIKD